MNCAIRLYDKSARYSYDDYDALIAYVVFDDSAYIPAMSWWDNIDAEIRDYDPRGELDINQTIRELLDEGDLAYDYIENPWDEDFDPSALDVYDVPVRI